MTAATVTRPRAKATTPAEGVVRTARHLYYFNGQGPWPGVTSITRVLDAPALTNWKLGEVARSAVENAERLVADREAGKVDAAVKYLTTLSTSAMDRGQRIHGNIESILRREPFNPDPRDADAVAGARAWLNQQVKEHGLRLGEAVALNWRDVDLDRGTVAVKSGKTARARRLVKLAPFAIAALRNHRARSTIVGAGEPVFRGIRTGRRIRTDAAYAHWQRLRADAGLPPMRIHDLRHAHASLLLAGGTPMQLIADQLGHANPALTARVYAHVLDSHREAAVDRMGELVPTRRTIAGTSS